MGDFSLSTNKKQETWSGLCIVLEGAGGTRFCWVPKPQAVRRKCLLARLKLTSFYKWRS